jgi:positive regulator of sigma E activity
LNKQTKGAVYLLVQLPPLVDTMATAVLLLIHVTFLNDQSIPDTILCIIISYILLRLQKEKPEKKQEAGIVRLRKKMALRAGETNE